MMLCKSMVLLMFLVGAPTHVLGGRVPPELEPNFGISRKCRKGSNFLASKKILESQADDGIWGLAIKLNFQDAFEDVLKIIEVGNHSTHAKLGQLMQDFLQIQNDLDEYYSEYYDVLDADDQVHILRTQIWRRDLFKSKGRQRFQNALQFCKESEYKTANEFLNLMSIFLAQDERVVEQLLQVEHNGLLCEESYLKRCLVHCTKDSSSKLRTRIETFVQIETKFKERMGQHGDRDFLANTLFELAARDFPSTKELLAHFFRHTRRHSEGKKVMSDLKRIIDFVKTQRGQAEIRGKLCEMYTDEKTVMETILNEFANKKWMDMAEFNKLVAATRKIVSFASSQKENGEIRGKLCRFYTGEEELMDRVLLLCKDEELLTSAEFDDRVDRVKMVWKEAEEFETIGQKDPLRKLLYKYYGKDVKASPERLIYYRALLTLSESHEIDGPGLTELQEALGALIKQLEDEQLRQREPSNASMPSRLPSRHSTILATMVPVDDRTSSASEPPLETNRAPVVQAPTDCIKVLRKKLRYITSGWEVRWMKREGDRLVFLKPGTDETKTELVKSESFNLRNVPGFVSDTEGDYLDLNIDNKHCGENMNPLGTGWMDSFHRFKDNEFHRHVKPVNPNPQNKDWLPSRAEWEVLAKLCTPVNEMHQVDALIQHIK